VQRKAQKRAIIQILQFSSATQKVRTMQTFTNAQAHAAVAAHANNNTLSVAQVQQLLANVSVTFAQILYVTNVLTAAAHKQQQLRKVTCANVILCSNINAHTSVYARKVQRSAAKIASNSAQAVAAFNAQDNYFAHTQCYSIVVHKQHASKYYLYAIYNNAQSLYLHNNNVVSKQHIAQFLTASAAQQLLQNNNTVHNVTHDITHNVHVRTIALSNIVQIKARKQIINV